MKKIFCAFALAVLLSGLFAGAAQANVGFSFEDIFITDSYGGTTERNTPFNINNPSDVPWLYIKLSASALNLTASLWKGPNMQNEIPVPNPASFLNQQEYWFSPLNWNSIKTLGDWDVAASTFSFSGTDSRHLRFSVTPEPVSSALFLLGGAALAVRQYRRKKS